MSADVLKLGFTPERMAELDRIAAARGVSRGDVINMALRVFTAVSDEMDQGRVDLVVRRPEDPGDERQIVWLWAGDGTPGVKSI